MSRFDYRAVWASSLMNEAVVVHEQGDGEKTKAYADGTSRVDVMTRCGAACRMRRYRDADGKTTSFHDFGAHIAVGHAKAIGAWFCRRCWPKGLDA